MITTEGNLVPVLLNIPFFGVGLTAIAMFVFVLLLKHITFLFVYLYIASLFAFSAAILDLSDILLAGAEAISVQPNDVPTSPLATAREIFLSTSTFFLFLFLWLLVARCPEHERTNPENLSVSDHRTPHSASWKRWGKLGIILQWSTLIACISIPLLEILWRVLRSQHFYGRVYIAESTIQTVLSFIFILKIFLNASLSQVPMTKLFLSYSVPFLSLVVSTSMGIMNVVQFAFSETITGRFLRATEIYLFIIYSLVSSFHQTPHLPAKNIPSEAGILPEKQAYGDIATAGETFRTPFPDIDRQSYTRNSLNWIQVRNTSRRLSHRPKLVGVQWTSNRDSPLLSSKPEVVSDLVEQDTRGSESSDRAADIPPVTERSVSRFDTARLDDVSSLSLGLTFRLPDGYDSGETRSSVLAIEGTGHADYLVDRTTSSSVSFNELILQQNELDRSIAGLRILSPPSSPFQSESSIKAIEIGETKAHVSGQDNVLGDLGRKESTSGRSEFSLSSFPPPPIISEGKFGRLGQSSILNDEDESRMMENNMYITSVAEGNTEHIVLADEILETNHNTESQPSRTLKPMFLSTTVSHTSLHESEALQSEAGSVIDHQDRERDRDNGKASLRPLILGTATPLHLAPRFSTVVPIGGRRNRQGSLASRPLISLPRPLRSGGDEIDSAFDSPRDPPLKPSTDKKG